MVDETEFELMDAEPLAIVEEMEKQVKKTRARKAATSKKEKLPNPAAGLLDALKFVSICQKKVGEQQVQFCIIANRWIAASNDVLTVATPIAEDFECNAHTHQLIDALKQVHGDLQMVALSEHCLSVKSGNFTGLVPCIPDGILNIDGPDASCAAISDALKPCLVSTASLTVEYAPNEYLAGILLQANSAVGTDGAAMIEHWHGFNLPTMLVPRQAALAIAKCPKQLTGFGYSGPTATFWFEDGSFIKTKLFKSNYPNYSIALDIENLNPFPIPEGLHGAVKLIEPFCSGGNVFFNEGFIYSDEEKINASSYKFEAVPDNTVFAVKRLLQILPYANSAHFYKEKRCVYFFGENLRGALMECGQIEKPKTGINSDDIPF